MWIELEDDPREIVPPPHLMYATRPREATGVDGHSYVIKGPGLSVVFAEAAGYELAAVAGLDVPPWGLWRDPRTGGIYFASRKLKVRLAADILLSTGGVENPELISTAMVVDTWIVNRDRNVNNVIATNGGASGRTRLVAIDFERAEALRGQFDAFTVTAFHPRECRPGDALTPFGRRSDAEDACCARVVSGREQVAGLVERVRMDLDLAEIGWLDSSIRLLESRATNIHRLVEEAWL